MPNLYFVEAGGAWRRVRAPVGITLMEAARQSGVAGILAQCGGAGACATCHVYVDQDWFERLPPREELEEGMLETAWEPRTNSRLSCQVTLTADLDGMSVTVPARQR